MVSWVDFRDYTGVFDGPVLAGSGRPDGTPWPFRDLHFDRGHYIAEIRRASADRSWETARRVTARLVREGLHARAMTLIAPDLALAWVAPAWQEDGVMISFENASSGFTPSAHQVLAVTAGYSDPERAAQDILRQLQAVPVSQRAHRFGWRPAHRSPEPQAGTPVCRVAPDQGTASAQPDGKVSDYATRQMRTFAVGPLRKRFCRSTMPL